MLGVEPDPRMVELARQGGTEIDVATVEAWDPVGRTFDAVPPQQLREAFGEVFARVLPDSPFSQFWARPALDGYRRHLHHVVRRSSGSRRIGR